MGWMEQYVKGQKACLHIGKKKMEKMNSTNHIYVRSVSLQSTQADD